MLPTLKLLPAHSFFSIISSRTPNKLSFNMSYAAFKMMQWPTGTENCESGFITRSVSDFVPKIPSITSDDLDSEWQPPKKEIGPIPNLIVTGGNVLEVYMVRIQEDGGNRGFKPPPEAKRGCSMGGISSASLELVCHYRLHGNVETMAILSRGGSDGSKRRDSIVLDFKDAKISVLEFDDSIHGLRTSSIHCFEGPEWHHLEGGRESFARGPLVKTDPQGRCVGVLVYSQQMIVPKAFQNLPHDAYKLIAVPSPIGGLLVISANAIHYHSQSASWGLALNNYAVLADNSQYVRRSNFNVEFDAANATWLLHDVLMLSTKTGELLLLTLVFDGRGSKERSSQACNAALETVDTSITKLHEWIYSSKNHLKQ